MFESIVARALWTRPAQDESVLTAGVLAVSVVEVCAMAEPLSIRLRWITPRTVAATWSAAIASSSGLGHASRGTPGRAEGRPAMGRPSAGGWRRAASALLLGEPERDGDVAVV